MARPSGERAADTRRERFIIRRATAGNDTRHDDPDTISLFIVLRVVAIRRRLESVIVGVARTFYGRFAVSVRSNRTRLKRVERVSSPATTECAARDVIFSFFGKTERKYLWYDVGRSRKLLFQNVRTKPRFVTERLPPPSLHTRALVFFLLCVVLFLYARLLTVTHFRELTMTLFFHRIKDTHLGRGSRSLGPG